MKKIVVGVLLLASATFATALSAQAPERPRYWFPASTTSAALQFNSGEQLADGTTSFREVTITIGEFVITADDATLEKTGFRLGANARVVLPAAPAK